MNANLLKSNKFKFVGLIVLVILGLWIHRDYGISLDEPAQRLIGIVNVNYVVHALGFDSILQNTHFPTFTRQTLMDLHDRHYGVIFELPAALLEFFFKPNEEDQIYFARHLLTFFYFLLGLIAIYKIAQERFQNSAVSALTCLMIIFSPRIFADAFYNDKDIVFLSMYAFAALSMIRFLLQPSWKSLLAHSLFTALAIDTRLIGIIFPVATLVIFILKWGRYGMGHTRLSLLLLGYLFTSSICVILFWPYMWSDPVGHFIEAFKFISLHPHSAAIPFLGQDIPTSNLPWYYLPVWISITTPILYTGLFIFGFVISCVNIARNKFLVFYENKLLIDLIFLGLFFAPIIAIALAHTSIYNGWRHLYFTYPFFILIGANGFYSLWGCAKKSQLVKLGCLIVIGANFSWIGWWMLAYHPLQNLYFNVLAGKNWISSFEADYWGLANRAALEKIIKSESLYPILIWPGASSKFKSGEPTVYSDQLLLLPHSIRSKIESPESIEDAKYIIATNRAHFSSQYLSKHGKYQKIDSVKIDDVEVLSIFSKRDLKSIRFTDKNTTISFAKDGLGIFYIYKAEPPINWELWSSDEWHTPEDWGVWTKGTRSSIDIPILNEHFKKATLHLKGFIAKEITSQNAEIWVNGKFLDKLVINSPIATTTEIPIPSEAFNTGVLKIELRGLRPISPEQIGINRDSRQLAIGLESISFQ